ncbi:hypothetical protein DCG74_29115 [Bradyrhizobium sp. WBAH42]|nr:hypothetical protein [Bradyrhizobium sp. WBAH30]MDD1546970.1 hypothetical protein [Bradyrhizobium sp. WBAH41]MDD1554217.1 hypothetical protein [Bradyrhizobium sp. WBAH23]MDD1562168.1 hypothetical protein [Bradyrhizobium sp. WBAH33]MDD1591703.1 hypothetical protein [Bradyrhizobium sp. WBAH42]NRB85226.1 hypothetical protein [Bradyrhizobium sp. WBAH10]QCJ92168.1 hypothetical protein DAA57_29545 [Bradyrhizobium yuanmingense]
MSDMSGAARWLAPAASAGRRNVWLACLIALTALLALGNLANDASLDLPYGWDVRVNCAAVDAHAEGLDPYFVKNLKGTNYSYPYLPVTLDVFRPLCAGGVLVDHYRSIYLVLAVLCGLLLPGLGRTRPGARDAGLKVLCALGAFVGFEFVLASGNFALLSGVLTAIALKLLLRPLASGRDLSFSLRLGGAALLGLVTSFKLVFFPVLAALYFLPLPRGRKLALIAVGAFAFALPVAVSRLLYPDLFASWLLAIAGQIPGQHAVGLVETNPSLLLLARDLMAQAGFGDSKPAMLAAYALAALALVLVPFAQSVLRAAASGSARGWTSLPTELDRWLMDHPRTAMRITVLAMFALYLCSPRLKEYAFFELALYAAILIVDLPPLALAAILGVGLALPALVSLLGAPIEGTFILLASALICFWILLLDFRAEPKRLEQG